MFDTTCADKVSFAVPEEVFRDFREAPLADSIGVLGWQEHCVECGQPECFKTCSKYSRSFDGKCRRFASGIVPICRRGRVFFGCEFKEWGKLEAIFTGRMWSWRVECRMAWGDRLLAAVARCINRLMAFVPGRIGAITIYRRLKLLSERFVCGRKDNTVDCLHLHVWADTGVKLHVVVIDGDKERFSTLVDLSRGWNEQKISLPPIRRGARLLLFSTAEDDFKLVFSDLSISNSGCVEIKREENSAGKVANDAQGYAKFVKCVAWDLDNTLWNGILVEDGVEGLTINERAVEVIKELDKRGIVHTVLSKNDHEAAWKALEHFGLAEYFVFPIINWNRKSVNLKEAAKRININPNTFAFVDDSAFERGDVAENCPMVRVFDESAIDSLPSLPEFNPPISAESAGRRLSYKKEMERYKAAEAYDGDYADFLKSCNIKLDFFDLRGAAEAEYDRCYELIQRSNQLTLTGNRYDKEAFKQLVDSQKMALGVRCSDRFGDYGIVGAIVVAEEGSHWRIKEFVMSCRVAKKGCEAMAINHIKDLMRQVGVEGLRADIVDTGRNGALKEAFKDIAF